MGSALCWHGGSPLGRARWTSPEGRIGAVSPCALVGPWSDTGAPSSVDHGRRCCGTRGPNAARLMSSERPLGCHSRSGLGERATTQPGALGAPVRARRAVQSRQPDGHAGHHVRLAWGASHSGVPCRARGPVRRDAGNPYPDVPVVHRTLTARRVRRGVRPVPSRSCARAARNVDLVVARRTCDRC